MMLGWLDGRRGLPQLPEDLSRPVNGAAIPAAESHWLPLANLSTEPRSASPSPRLRTSRMDALTSQARELIEGEKIRFGDEWAVLKRESAQFLKSQDALTDEVALTREKLEQARIRLSGQEREDRRLAEQDAQNRPAGLVRARRQTAWERRLGTAEQQHQSVTASLADATCQAQLREELIRDRAEVARAAARRHHELARRRIATYLQQLIRTHRQGADLNRLLQQFPVGPDLPEWTKDPTAGQSGIEQMLAEDSAPITHDPYLRNETSGP